MFRVGYLRPDRYNWLLGKGEGGTPIDTYRILMVAPTSFFADYGCHVRILEEIRALQGRGHTVRVATYHNGDEVDGVDIRRTVGLPWRTRLMVGSSRHKVYLDAVLFFEVLKQAFRFKPDIIHAHLHEGALIASVVGRIIRRPVVFDYQGSLTEEMLDHRFIRPGGLRERVMRRVEQVIDYLPSVITPSGTAARDHLIAKGIASERIVLLSDAVDTATFNPELHGPDRERTRARLGIPGNARVVMYLGLLAEYQGTSLLLDAADNLLDSNPDLYFVIAGYPGVDHYARKSSTLKHADRILFPGRIAYRDAPQLLAAGDVAVAPKLSKTEGNGKIFNYMALGLPVVAIDSEPNQLILGGLGHLIPPHDPAAFARGIQAALDDTLATRSALRERIVKHYSWNERVHLLESIYDRVSGREIRVALQVPSDGQRPRSQIAPDMIVIERQKSRHATARDHTAT
jgi:glycosyltransferase involved in cell wall biosynthesis